MKNNRGFTLVELLITITILLIVLTLIGTFLVKSFEIFRDSSERVNNNRLTQIMIEDISQNIREYSFFDFKTNDIWKFSSDKADDFHINYDENENKLILKKSDTEFRTLEGVVDFQLNNYVSEEIAVYNNQKIEFTNGIIINFEDDKIIFTDDIKIFYVDNSGDTQEKNITGGTIIRLLEGSEIRFEVDGTTVEQDKVRKIVIDGTKINFNNNAFEFKISVDLGNGNVIEELKTVYPRNFSFWR